MILLLPENIRDLREQKELRRKAFFQSVERAIFYLWNIDVYRTLFDRRFHLGEFFLRDFLTISKASVTCACDT